MNRELAAFMLLGREVLSEPVGEATVLFAERKVTPLAEVWTSTGRPARSEAMAKVLRIMRSEAEVEVLKGPKVVALLSGMKVQVRVLAAGV